MELTLQAGMHISVLGMNDNPVYNAVFSPDGTTILTAQQDGTACVWDASTGNLVLTLH